MKAILKQTSWLFLAQALSRVIGFFYTIFLAKNLGVSGFGLLTVSLAYFSLISAIADFGFNRFLIREIALKTSKKSELLWNVAMLRLTLTAFLFAVFAIILYIFDADKLRVSLSLLAVLALLPLSLAQTFDAIFVARQKLQISAISVIISSLAIALMGIYFVREGLGVMGVINALIWGQFIYLLVLFLFLMKFNFFTISSIKSSIIKEITWESLPYGLLGILGLLYFRIDSVLLSYLRGSFETGLYGAAFRFLESIVFIPTALGTALFPTLARLHLKNSQRIKVLYFKSIKITLIIALLIVFVYLTILPLIIKIYLPDYVKSLDAIKVLSLAIPFMFLHIPASAVVLSSDKYLKPIILLSCLPLSFNILMNLQFIPLYGFMAAAWVTVASDILSFLLIFIFIKKTVLKDG